MNTPKTIGKRKLNKYKKEAEQLFKEYMQKVNHHITQLSLKYSNDV